MADERVVHETDCVKLMSGMADESVDLVIADPPYFGIVDEDWDRQWASLDEYIVWLSVVFSGFTRVLRPGGACCVWSSITNYPRVQLELNAHLDYAFTVTWKKQRGRGAGWGFNREELCVNTKGPHRFRKVESQTLNLPHLRKGSIDYSNGGRRVRGRDYKLASSVWDDIPQVCSYRKQLHPTEKPVECALRMLLASSAEGDLVYVPFAGSGSELEACERLNRRWVASDTDPQYVRVAQERVSAAGQGTG